MTDRAGRDRSELHGACNGDRVDGADRGIVASPEFLAYQDRLRSTWTADERLAAKHGVPAGTGRFYETNMSESQTGETDEQLPNPKIGRRAFCIGAATTIALAGTGVAAANNSELAYGSDYVADPFLSADLTIAQHKSSFSSALMYEDDEGNDVEIPAVIDDRDPNTDDETTRNLYGVRADKVAASGYNAFPRDAQYDEDGDGESNTDVRAIDATHWAVDEANTAGTMSVADGSGDVDSLQVSTSSVAAGEFATATFDLVAHDAAITSDEDKRYLQLVVNVDALSADSVVEIRAVDADGDYRAGVIDSSADGTVESTIATATGTGIGYQVKLADLTTEGSGDGTFDDIEAIEIEVAEADATVEIFGLDLERKSRWEFGEEVINEHTDDEETVTVYEPEGVVRYTDLSGGVLSDATIYDLEVPVKYLASESDEGGQWSSTEAANYPSFDKRLKQIERLATKAAIDLSHANLALEIKQTLPSDRFHGLEIAEATADTDDPDDMSWTDVSGSLNGSGEFAVLEDLVQSGTQYAVRIRTVLTDDEFETATSPDSGGGGMFGARSSGGGMFSGARGLVLAVGAALAGYFGFIRKRLPFTG